MQSKKLAIFLDLALFLLIFAVMIGRTITSQISRRMHGGKAIIILGARQVGKTTLLKGLFEGRKDVLWLTGDDPDVRAILEGMTTTLMRHYIGSANVVVIDEAQRIADVGLKIKLITDGIPEVQVIATGSSAFEISGQVNEPLTGRKWEYILHPLSFREMAAHHGLIEEQRLLTHRLVFGYYPDVVTNPGDEREVLTTLATSYLYKDVLAVDRVKKSDAMSRLVQAIAYQVGSEVSMNELGQICGLDPKTVERYVTLLEQAYIIFRLPSYSRNMRNELRRSRKIFFWDNGVRNAVIGNFAPVATRGDVGQLFENFVIAERIKQQQYARTFSRPWFWRTTTGQEVDYIEEQDGQIAAYEVKWNSRKRVSPPAAFRNAYPQAPFNIITPDSLPAFLIDGTTHSHIS